MRARHLAASWLSLTACATGQRAESASPADRPNAGCVRQLPPRQEPLPSRADTAERGARPEAKREVSMERKPSRIVAHLELPLSKLGAELERRAGRRLAEARDVDIGPAGVLHYTVDRDAFSLSVARERLIVEAPVRARAEACSGRSCYASCEPQGVARLELSLALRSDYRFEPARASFRFTRACRVRLLGGFLSVDVTSSLQAEATRRLSRLARELDRGLPDVHAEVARVYNALAKPLTLPMIGCVALRPVGIVQGPIEDSTRAVRARFALRAEPELRPECGEAAQPRAGEVVALPALERDVALPVEDVSALDMVLPLATFASAFERSAPIAGQPRPRVTRAVIERSGHGMSAALSLTGETCGTVSVRAEPSYAGDGRFIALQAASLDATDAARARAVALDPAVLARSLADGVHVAPPLSLSAVRAALPLLGSMLSTPELSVDARLSSIRPAGAFIHGEGVVARLEARGSVRVTVE